MTSLTQSTEDPPASVSRPGRQTTVAVLVAGLLGAIALPVTGVGIGWVVAALGPLGAIAVARRAVRPSTAVSTVDRAGPGDRTWRLAAGMAALALVLVAGVRSAGWLVSTCLVVSGPLASYALAGGRTSLGLIRGGAALFAETLRGLGGNAAGRTRSPAGRRRVGQTLAGLAGGVTLLLVFGSLFRAADPAFADLLEQWRHRVSMWTILRTGLGLAIMAALAAGAVRVMRRAKQPEPPAISDLHLPTAGLAVWAIPIGMLDMLFGLFVWVQVTTLFAGDDYVLGPGGPDYADYARDGSAQLALVAVLTLAVIAAVAVWVRPSARTERTLLRLLGGILCGLTLVVVASALRRLALYADAYGFTLPRLLVFTTIVWLGIVFILLLAAGVRLGATWLPRAAVAATVGVLLGLAVVNPEAQMARTHIDRLTDDYPLDPAFLGRLSADAVDALDGLPEPQRTCVLRRLASDLTRREAWYEWNVARDHARAVLAARPLRPTCVWPPTPARGR